MKKIYSTILVLTFLLLPLQMQAEGAAIKLEFGGTSMTVELSQQPKIMSENGNIVLKTNSMSVMLALPCKVTPTDGSGTAIDKVTIRNNEDNAPINVFTLDGKKAQMSNEQVIKDLKRLVEALPEVQREVVHMRYFQELSFKEIAERTNVSINTSLGRMRYALINLRKLTREHNVDLTIEP